MIIKDYSGSLSEIRRVLKKLSNSIIADRMMLSTLSHSVVIANYITEAAAPTKSKYVSPTTRKNLLVVRGPGSSKATPSRKVETTIDKNLVGKLADLLASRTEKSEVAEHIHELLQHHFESDDPRVSRMQKHATDLVNQHNDLLDETKNTLNKIAKKHIPVQFQDVVDDIVAKLKERLKGQYRSFKLQHAVTVKTDNNGHQITIFIVYLIFDELQGKHDTTQDYIIVVSEMIKKGHATDYIRTLMQYKPPTWLIQRPLGMEFDSVDRAVHIVLQSMHTEGLLDVIEPSAIPLKTSQIKLNHDQIQLTKIDDDKGLIKVYLKPQVKDENKARDIASELFLQLKKLIKMVHPRYKNPIHMSTPRKVNVKIGKSPQSLYLINFGFSKLDGGEVPELNREQIKEFMNIFHIDNPEVAKDFNHTLKNFMGGKNG